MVKVKHVFIKDKKTKSVSEMLLALPQITFVITFFNGPFVIFLLSTQYFVSLLFFIADSA